MRGIATETMAAAVACGLFACALLACRPGAGSSDPAPDDRHNVLLVTVDTLRADRLGAYGFPLDTSPHIDRLAAEGVVFERAVAASSATAPSHASIMTSRFVREHSVGYSNGGSRLEGATTLAEVFREAGYRTAAFVGNMLLRRRSGLDAGFEVYDDELLEPERNRGRIYERIAEETTTRALSWLRGRDEAPFFLWVHYQDPHGPYAPPRRAEGRFRVRGDPSQAELPVLSSDSGYGGIPAYQALPGLFLPSQYESRYADEIHYADAELGRLLAAADRQASGRDTVVLLTADHGESFGENDRWFMHHFTSTPENAHVPLVVKAPGLTPQRVPGVAHHVDVMPTLLDLANLDLPQALSGLSLTAALGHGALPERIVYCDTGREVSGYDASGFVRVLGVEGAWTAPSREPGRDPLWVRFRWEPGGRWSREPSGGELDPEIRRYLAHALPLKLAPKMDPAMTERLRALGYAAE